MSATITVSNEAEIYRKMRQYSEVSQKDFAQICNDKGLDLSIKSTQETDRADAGKIAQVLGKIADTFVRSRKTGKTRKGKAVYKDNSFAAAIINARREKAGEPLLFGKELHAAAVKMANARIRAVGFVKSTWLRCEKKMRAFGKAGAGSGNSAKVFGIDKSKVIPAKNGLRPEAVIIAKHESPEAAEIALAGLKKAGPRAIADMNVYIERKLKERAAKL